MDYQTLVALFASAILCVKLIQVVISIFGSKKWSPADPNCPYCGGDGMAPGYDEHGNRSFTRCTCTMN